MTPVQLWLVILGGMLVTFLTRVMFIVIVPPEKMPQIVQDGLKYVPSAVLAALILPEMVIADGAFFVSLENDRLIAGLVAALIAWRFQNIWITIVVGLGLLWILG